jgi:tetratricopeptide (TPR) repeat protein
MRQLLLIFSIIFLGFIASSAQEEAKAAYKAGAKNLKQKNYEAAIEDFTKAIEMGEAKEGVKMSYIYRGFAKNGLGKYKEAIEDFTKAIEIDSTDLASYIDRGLAKSYSGDRQGAVEDFKYILTQDSTGDQAQGAYYYLGLIAHHAGEYQQANEYYDKLILLVPKGSEAYFNRGAAKDMLMDPEGSIADYDMAIKYNPNYMEAYANRGFAKINLLTGKGNIRPSKSETEDACKDLKKAKEMGDNSVDDMIYIYCK